VKDIENTLKCKSPVRIASPMECLLSASHYFFYSDNPNDWEKAVALSLQAASIDVIWSTRRILGPEFGLWIRNAALLPEERRRGFAKLLCIVGMCLDKALKDPDTWFVNEVEQIKRVVIAFGDKLDLETEILSLKALFKTLNRPAFQTSDAIHRFTSDGSTLTSTTSNGDKDEYNGKDFIPLPPLKGLKGDPELFRANDTGRSPSNEQQNPHKVVEAFLKSSNPDIPCNWSLSLRMLITSLLFIVLFLSYVLFRKTATFTN
jgi:hypothetical protein